MPEEIAVIALVSLIASSAIIGKLVWAYADRLKHREITPKSIAILDARMERIEHAVDAIAVEVERISEGQRFTTKLLSERADAAPALSAPAKNRN